jgi:V/A-type H+-transporting ATPase subunit C
MLKDTDYAKLAGYLRVAEKRLLASDGIERVLDTPTVAETAKNLSQNTGYDFSVLVRPEDYESVLSSGLKEKYSELYKIAPEPDVIDVLLCKYDYHNIKVAVKSKFFDISGEDLYCAFTDVDYGCIVGYLDGAKPEKLPKHLIEAIDIGVGAYEKTENPQEIDVALDAHMFGYQAALASALGYEYLSELIKLSVDFYNIKTFLRAKNMDRDLKFLKDALSPEGKFPVSLLTDNFEKDIISLADTYSYKYFGDILKNAVEEYEKTGNLSTLEKYFDNYLINHIKKSKYVSLGPEIIVGYVFSLENEARQIRIIMTGKINNIAPDVLRERLRDNHV